MEYTLKTEPVYIQPSRSNLSDADRNGLLIQFGVLIAILMGFIAAALIILASQHPLIQYILLAVAQGMALAITIAALIRVWKSTTTRIFLLLAGFSTTMLALAVFANGQVVSAALVNLAFGILVSSFSGIEKTAGRAITYSIVSSWIISLVGQVLPVEKITLPGVDIAIPSILGIFAMVYLTLLAMEWITATLRVRLILGSLAIVIIPLFAISSIQSILVQNSVTERLRSNLNSSALQVSELVDNWLANNRDLLSREASLAIFPNYLLLTPQERKDSAAEKELNIGFQALAKQNRDYLISFGLIDRLGVVLLDTNPDEVGIPEGFAGNYAASMNGSNVISNIIFSKTENRPYIIFTSPIFDNDRNFLGILRAKYDAQVFQFLMEENTGLSGPVTYPILVDDNLLRLGDAYDSTQVFKTLGTMSSSMIADLKLQLRIPDLAPGSLSTQLTDLANTLQYDPNVDFTSVRFDPEDTSETGLSYVSIIHLYNKPWILMYTQSSVAFTQLSVQQQQTTILFAVLLAGIVGVVAILIAGSLTQPIAQLTKTAERITAGDLSVNAPVSNDELGVLANTFNIMTARLRQFINELEDRVMARTSELAQRNDALTIRSRQIQTISEVARAITSSHEVENLLSEVTALVSERFGFYHVGIFLTDDNREYALLRAANSEGGQRMLARQHKLGVGQVGIVGYVTGTGLPRIATDVGSDAVFFNNPDLPLTRSEMALPLISNHNVIGALDVQSTQPNAFSQEDVELFTTLADQITIAIANSHSFEETQRALAEARLVHQQYLRQEWSHEAREKLHTAYEYTPKGVVSRDQMVSEEFDRVFESGQPMVRDGTSQQTNAAEPATMGVPIKLRGETIGIIHVQDQNGQREWANEEIETVQSIADQVAQALENARLFEQTVRRAERERKVLEITSKIRSTNDPQKMLQVAMEELQLALRASKTQVILNPVEGPANGTQPTGNRHVYGGNGNSGHVKG